MFRIGEFSKLSHVTIKTLRHYDKQGLLKPTEVDPFTGYRYYSADQLPRLNRILALKGMGLSLDEIGRLLEKDLPIDEMRGILRLKQSQLQAQLEEQQAQLDIVAWRLNQMEREETMTAQEITIKRIPAIRAACLRDTIPTYSAVGELFEEAYGFLGQHGVQIIGAPFEMCHDEEYREQDVDVEIAVPVAGDIPAGSRLVVRDLPAVESAACMVHQGPYETLTASYGHLMEWLEANGYRICAPTREVYVRGPDEATTPADYITEIQAPVEKA
jgi:DNA-binding transcriptional MerR regulator